MDKYWIGEANGKFFIFDHENQFITSSYVALFSVNDEEFFLFKKEKVKDIILSAKYSDDIVESYLVWRAVHNHINNLDIIEDVESFLDFGPDGLRNTCDYPLKLKPLVSSCDRDTIFGWRQFSGRVTHCYSCKRGLSSYSGNTCKTCQWIRCQCGACGCRYG